MEMKDLIVLRDKLKEFKRPAWTGKEEGKKIKFENYKSETLKRIEMILDMQAKIEKYLKDIDEYYLQIFKISTVDFLGKYDMPNASDPAIRETRKSPLLPI